MKNQNILIKDNKIFKNIKKIDGFTKIKSLNNNIDIKKANPRILKKQIYSNLSLSSLFIYENNNNSNTNNSIIISIISFLSYKDLLELQGISKKFYSILKSPKIRKEYILHSNISKNEHLLFYESNINIKKLKDNLVNELSDHKISSNIYKNILSLSNDSKTKNQKYSHVIQEIERDINRTFYTEKFKKGNGKTMLINILSALAFIRPEIGYCQGMNFIAGALIDLIEEEEKIFWIFLSFIDNIDLNLLFLKNMPDYSIRVFQLNYYIKKYLPKLFNHLKNQQINIDIFFSKWILTIFANYLPFEKLYKVWDIFIIEKWKAIFRISIILLGMMKDKLINLDLTEFCLFFKSDEVKKNIDFKYICQHYRDYKITNKKLGELKEEFFVEKVKEKLDDKMDEWDIDQKQFVIIYQKELNNHEIQIKEEIEILQNKIEKINKKCEKKNQKVTKLLDSIKNYKIQIETNVEVKAGYEKVLKRNGGEELNSNIINPDYNYNNNNNDINLGININVNHNIDDIKNIQKDNKINIINNHNNIYVNNINIISHNNFDFKNSYHINSFNNNLSNDRRYANVTKSSSNYRNQKKNDSNRKLSFKKFSKFKIFGKKSNELDKIRIKIINLEKEINSLNKLLMEQYKIYDKKKLSLEKSLNKKEEYKKKLEELIGESQKFKNDLLKNLSKKLKLSAKFVNTNNY